MSRSDFATSTVACTSVMIAGTLMLSWVAPAYGHNGGFRDFRPLNAGANGHAIKGLWLQSLAPLPMMTIQPMPTGLGSNPNAPPIPGVNTGSTRSRVLDAPPMTIQPAPTGAGSNPDAPRIPGVNTGSTIHQFDQLPPMTIQPTPTGAGSNPDAPRIPGVNAGSTISPVDQLPPMTIQPTSTGAGSNPDAPRIPGVNNGSTISPVDQLPLMTIQPTSTGAGSNPDAPRIPGVNSGSTISPVDQFPLMTIQPTSTGAGSNPDAPKIPGVNSGSTISPVDQLPLMTIQPTSTGAGSNPDAPRIPGINSGSTISPVDQLPLMTIQPTSTGAGSNPDAPRIPGVNNGSTRRYADGLLSMTIQTVGNDIDSLGAAGGAQGLSVGSGLTAIDFGKTESAFSNSPSNSFVQNQSNTLLNMVAVSDIPDGMANIAQTNINIITATQAAATASEIGNDDDSNLISSGSLSNFCGGSLCADSQMYDAITSDDTSGSVIKSNVPHVALTKEVSLKSGKTLFVPTRDTIVQTPLGEIELRAGSVTLVSSNHTGVELFNIHDAAKNAVSMIVEGQKFSISPGRHILVTREKGNDFASANQVETIQHRCLDSRSIGNNITLYSSEFSTLSAMDTVIPLRVVCASKHPQSRKLAAKMLKTTAVIMQLSGNNEYRQYVKQRLAFAAH